MSARQATGLELIHGKQKMPVEEAEKIELHVLICLDAAKRGLCTPAMSNTLTEHLLIAALLWKKLGNKPLMAEAEKAWRAQAKSIGRCPAAMQDLTTGEYKAIRIAVAHYVRSLVKVEIAALAWACVKAIEHLNPELAARRAA